MIDEADRILDIGFEEELKQIINILPSTYEMYQYSIPVSCNCYEFENVTLIMI